MEQTLVVAVGQGERGTGQVVGAGEGDPDPGPPVRQPEAEQFQRGMWGGIATSRARLLGVLTIGVSGSGQTTARVMVKRVSR